MPNIIAIAKDEKLLADLERICQELVKEDLHFAAFKSSEEFESLYFKSSSPSQSDKENDEESAPEDLRLFSHIHIILMAEDALKGKIKDTALEYLTKTRQKGFWPEENRPRILAFRFAEDIFDKLSFTHPALEDLVFLPLDKPLLMQKLEIYLNLPKLIKPSYLYSHETKIPIEISKIVTLDRLNDCALAIRNKVPLMVGVRGKFYLFPPGSKNVIRFFGKVYRTEPHPEYPGEFLVYFFLFGVRKTEISTIRQWLSSSSHYQSLKDESTKAFFINPDDMFLTEEEKALYSIAIVDPDVDHTKNLVHFLERKVDRLSISHFDSFSAFYELGLATQGSEDSDSFVPQPSTAEHLPATGLRFTCNSESKALTKVEIKDPENDRFCGHLMSEYFQEGEKNWWSLFELKQNEIIFKEAISQPGETKRILFAKTSEAQWLGFDVTFKPEGSDVEVLIEPLDSAQLAERYLPYKKLPKLSALIIDARLIANVNFDSWKTALFERAMAAGAIGKPEDLKIILTSESESHMDESWLHTNQVIALLQKPVDQKSMAVVLTEALRNPNTPYRFDNLGWITPGLKTHLSKPVVLERVSEYGATINTSTPFKEGSFFFLRKSIFDEAPNNCLAARVYQSEPHPSEEGRYQVHVTYFGINDNFLKHARSFVREQYAAAKEKSG